MILAAFGTKKDLLEAAARLREARIGEVETYTPTELTPKATPDAQASRLPLLMLLVGVGIALGFFFMEAYSTNIDFPFIVGGRPGLGWEPYVINAFEVGVLAAVATGFFGFLIANRLPRLYEPIDEVQAFRNAMRDGYFLSLRSLHPEQARALLATLRPELVEEVPE